MSETMTPPDTPGMTEAEVRRAEKMALEAKMKSGANWFYWIAGLSVVNSLVLAFGGGWSFIVGLGITQVIDVFSMELGVAPVAIALDAVVVLTFLAFGFFAGKGFSAAFWIGSILYVFDGLIFVLVGDWLSVGFHVFALVGIFGGLQALGQLKGIQSDPFTEPGPQV